MNSVYLAVGKRWTGSTPAQGSGQSPVRREFRLPGLLLTVAWSTAPSQWRIAHIHAVPRRNCRGCVVLTLRNRPPVPL